MNLGPVCMTSRELLAEVQKKYEAAPAFVKSQLEPMLNLQEQIIDRLDVIEAELIAMDAGVNHAES